MTTQSHRSWAPGAFIFVLVMCLVYATGAAKQTRASLADVQSRLALSEALVAQQEQSAALEQERHLDALGALGDDLTKCENRVDALETQANPSHHHPSHDTPIFAQEWHP